MTEMLRVRGLTKHFPVRRGVLRRVVGTVQAVNDVSFDVAEGLPPFNLSTRPGACVFWQSPRETAGWCAGLP